MMATHDVGSAVCLKLQRGRTSQGISVISPPMAVGSVGNRGTAVISSLSSCRIETSAGVSAYPIGLVLP